jgi:hypothetical protein
MTHNDDYDFRFRGSGFRGSRVLVFGCWLLIYVLLITSDQPVSAVV